MCGYGYAMTYEYIHSRKQGAEIQMWKSESSRSGLSTHSSSRQRALHSADHRKVRTTPTDVAVGNQVTSVGCRRGKHGYLGCVCAQGPALHSCLCRHGYGEVVCLCCWNGDSRHSQGSGANSGTTATNPWVLSSSVGSSPHPLGGSSALLGSEIHISGSTGACSIALQIVSEAKASPSQMPVCYLK